MRCAQCQRENPADAKFCNACGAKLDDSCPQCGRVNPVGSRFCNECGTSLASTPQPLVPSSRFKVQSPHPQPPASYTPKHLAERIEAEREAMEARGVAEGERKRITALFADIKGSTDLIADLDPEEARAILDPTLKLMMDAVPRYEGYVAQSLGDGIFALFGAPIVFSQGLRLSIMEFVRTEPRLVKTKYRYHCQDAKGRLLFRYDDAPHHPTDTFPHYKQVQTDKGEHVLSSSPPSLAALLDEVISFNP